MNVLSLCSGIGGLELGLERAGMTTVGQVEIDPFCLKVLHKHWPKVSKHDDVRTVIRWWRSQPRPRVDVVTAGFPCQPVSQAGRKRAQDDERWLWPDVADVVYAIRPRWVIAENVPGLRTRGLAAVLADLRSIGYRARAGEISACAMGAPHARRRLFILAHTDCVAGKASSAREVHTEPSSPRSVDRIDRCDWASGNHWAVEPDVGRVADGVPSRVDRLRALGNAVVPQVGEYVGRLVMAAEDAP